MTWSEVEQLAEKCIEMKLSDEELDNVASNLPFFDSCNFVAIMEKKGRRVII